jgi:organic radical activating enzyme
MVQKDPTKHDFVSEIVNGPEMREMRLKIIEQQKNYIRQCDKCCCMIRSDRNMFFRHVEKTPEDLSPKINHAKGHMQRVVNNRKWPHGSIDLIDEIQVEPSFPCNLRCPGCLHGKFKRPLDREDPPYVLPLDSFKRIIDSTLYHGVTTKRISFVGRGEPTLNRDFPAMLDYMQGYKTHSLMDTNANQPYDPSYRVLSWINCSIDGSTAESYDTYRRGGKFDKVVQFMRDAVDDGANVRWKYILFDTTESDELMLKALRMSKEIGVGKIRFIITHIGAKDKTVMPGKKTMPEIEKFLASQSIFEEAEVRYAS